MRTFVCVFTKVFPKSLPFMPERPKEDSGGNYMDTDAVLSFLAAVLGDSDAPAVPWGVPGTPGGKDHGAGLFECIARTPRISDSPCSLCSTLIAALGCACIHKAAFALGVS